MRPDLLRKFSEFGLPCLPWGRLEEDVLYISSQEECVCVSLIADDLGHSGITKWSDLIGPVARWS